MPAWVLTGFEDYFKRIQPFVQTQVIELPMAKRGKNDSEADILKYCQIEGESILNALKPNETLIALEVGGRELSTEKLADTMKQWMLEGNDVALAIGTRWLVRSGTQSRCLALVTFKTYYAAPFSTYFINRTTLPSNEH